MSQFVFDSGSIFAVTNVDTTPVKIGSLQTISADFDVKLVPTPLQLQVSVGMLINSFRLKFRAKMAQISSQVFCKLFLGVAPATNLGSYFLQKDFKATVPSVSPYTVDIRGGGPYSFNKDLGVQYDSTGLPLTSVPANPIVGQYSNNASTYTFAAADAGKVMVMNAVLAQNGGSILTFANSFKSYAPYFFIVLEGLYNGKHMLFQLFKCASDAFRLETLLENFSMNNFEFEAIADASGNIGIFSFAD